MTEKVIISGFGGQGVMSIGQMLTYAGMKEGKHVSWLPSYGPEMRGGTANCNVILSGNPIASPIVTNATSAILLNKPSLTKFKESVDKDGIMILNSSLIDEKVEINQVKTYSIPANQIASDLGNNRIANMVLLGAYLELTKIVDVESVINAILKVLGESKAKFIPINRKALAIGADYVRM
jgi:2-oxoglutarate ferredoxin oxidoreductase subunit gamma